MTPLIAFVLSLLVHLPVSGPEDPPAPPAPLSHTALAIDGTKVDLSEFEGRVVLIVNVASKCGLTPQYEALEKLHREFEDEGLVVLAFPCNQFLGQEPGSNEEIAAFCKTSYDVTFRLFEKVDVKGEDAHPVFRSLTTTPTVRVGPGDGVEEGATGDPEWNFTKFLLGRDGHLQARFHPTVTPADERVRDRVREALEAED